MKDALNVKVYADLRNYQMAMARLPGITKAATSRASSAVMGLALAVGAIGIAATRVGATFQQTMTETATVTQATTKEFDNMIKKARELGKTTTFTASQAGKGMYYLASAGFSATEVIEAADYSLKLAGATASDVDYTMASVAATLKQFGLVATDTKRVTDTFAQAISTSQLTMWRLTEALKYAGTAGAGFGLTLEDTVAALAQYANLGLEGSMIGTQFRRAMTMAAKGTAKSEQALRKYGLTQRDINPETEGFVGILEKIGEAGVSATDSIKMFGIRAGANMARLGAMMKAGLLPMQEYAQSLIGAQEGIGRTQEMYNKMMDTFKSQGIIVLSALQDMLIEVFNLYSKEGQSAFESLTKEIWKVTDAIYQNKDELAKWANYVIEAITYVFKAFKMLAQVVWDAREHLGVLIALQLGVILLGWVKSIYATIKAMNLLTLSLAAAGGWITIIGALIIGAFSFKHLYNNFKTFRNTVDVTLAGVHMAWVKLKSGTEKVFETIWSIAKVTFNDLADFILRPIKFIIRQLVKLADAAPDWMKPAYYGPLRAEIMGWAEDTKTSTQLALQEMERLSLALTDIDDKEKEAILTIQTALKLRLLENEEYFKNLNKKKTGIAEITAKEKQYREEVQRIKNLYKEIPEDELKAMEAMMNKYDDLFSLGSEWVKILDKLTQYYKAAWTTGGEWAASYLTAMEKQNTALIKYIDLLAKRIKLETKLSAVQAKLSYAEALRDYYREFGSILQGMSAGWNDYWDSVKTSSEAAADAMVQTLEGMQQAFSNTFFKVLKNDMDEFEKIWEDFGDRLVKIISDRMSDNLMGTLKESVEGGAIGKILDKVGLGGLAKSIMQGKKDPNLIVLEAQLDLQIKDIDIQQKILQAILASKEIDEKVKASIMSSKPGGYSMPNISQLKNIYGGGGGNTAGLTAGEAARAGMAGPSNAQGVYSAGGGAATTAGTSKMALYGGRALGAVGAAYGAYTTLNPASYEGMSSGRGAASGAMSGMMAGAALGSVVPVIGTAIGAIGGAIVGAIAGGVMADDSETKGLQRVKEYTENLKQIMETEYQSLTRMTRDFTDVLSHKHVKAMGDYGDATIATVTALHALAETLALAKNSAETWGTVLGSVQTMMHLNFQAIREWLTIMGEKGEQSWQTLTKLEEKMKKLGVEESMRRASTSLTDAALVQYQAYLDLRNGTDLLTVANNQSTLSLEMLGNTFMKTDQEITALYETYREVRAEQVALSKAQEESAKWMELMASDTYLTNEELLAITTRLEQLGSAMKNTFQVMHEMFAGINERIINTAEMVAAMPDSLSSIRTVMMDILKITKYLSMSGEAAVTLVESSQTISESWQEISAAITQADFDKVAAGVAKMTVAYGDMAASMIQLSQASSIVGATGMARGAGALGSIFMVIEGFLTLGQILKAFINIVDGLVRTAAHWISKNEEAVKFWKNLEKATENLPIIGGWIAKFVEKIDASLGGTGSLPLNKLYEKNEALKTFFDDLDEMLRTFDYTGTIDELRKDVDHFTYEFALGMMEDFDTRQEGVERAIEDGVNLRDALYDLGQALKDLKTGWEDFIDDIVDSQKDLETEYLKPAERLARANADWVLTYQEYLAATDEEKLEKAKELLEVHMEVYEAEKAILLEKHELEMDNALAFIDTIETMKERQVDFLKSVDDQLKSMEQTIGSPGDQFTSTRLQIEDLKGQIAGASGEERLDLIEELQKLYDKYLGQGASLYGSDSTNYGKVVEQVTTGLGNLKNTYKEETDALIDAAEIGLADILGITQEQLVVGKAIEDLAEKQRVELNSLNQKWATSLGWFNEQATVQVSLIDEEIEEVKTALTGVGEVVKLAIEMQNFPSDPLGYWDTEKAVKWGVFLGMTLWGAGRLLVPGVATGMDYVPHDQWRYLHEGESVIRKGQPEATGGGGSTNFVFVPYGMSEMEQERLFNEVVKPQLLSQSENEQFIYDNAVIKTNRGI